MIATIKNQFVLLMIAGMCFACAKPNTKPVSSPIAVKPAAKDCNCATDQTPTDQPPTMRLPSTDKTRDSVPLNIVNTEDYSGLKLAKWEDIDGLLEDDLTAAWTAWLQSCSTLSKQPLPKQSLTNGLNNHKPQWHAACNAANSLIKPNNATIIAYLTNQFNVYSTANQDGSQSGLITGYYQPLLRGSLKQSDQYRYPLYNEPEDLITVELDDIYPDLKFKRVRGRLQNVKNVQKSNDLKSSEQIVSDQIVSDQIVSDQKSSHQKLIPYLTRAEIEAEPSPLTGNELVWIDDIIDVFFLQIQGSGLINLDTGQQVHVGYANQNGHAYHSIGRLLIERGELTSDQASMQGIKNWARNHLGQLRDLLNSNPSYVFFRKLPDGLPGPIGGLGIPITAGRSVAIDPKYIPLGAPLFLSTTQPNSATPLKRLMVAQDTGGAIKGGVRADYFWGTGEIAGKQAGAMKQQGKIWVLLPKSFTLKP